MYLEQFYLACLSQASYLVGDEQAGLAAVIDPRRDVEIYLEAAKRRGLQIRWVLLTHFHADFIAGHLELARLSGATIGLGASAQADFAFEPLAHGRRIALGKVQLEVRATPGHTPEAISIVVYDTAVDAEQPVAVFTGDTLFLGDVGRPDLLVSKGRSAQELAGELYDSLHEQLLTLPDQVVVYPGHGAGSACGKSLSKETSGRLGDQRRTNYALQPMSRADFVRQLTVDQSAPPYYFAHDADHNRRQRRVLDEVLATSLAPLTLERLLALRAAGASVLDVREPDEFAAAHLAGSLNIGLSGKFAHWAGQVLRAEEPLVLIAPPGKEREAAVRLARIGFEGVQGFLAGGAEAFKTRPELLAQLERIDSQQLARRLAAAQPPLVLDVRAAAERAAARIEPSLHIPLEELRARAAELPRERALVIHCAGGYRSMIAASLLLERAGLRGAPRSDLIGGMAAWQAAHQPVASGS